MFDVGGPEFIFLLLLALIVFGPDRLPGIGRQIGTHVAKLREAWLDFRRTLDREVALKDLSQAGREIEKLAGDARSVGRSVFGGDSESPAAGSSPAGNKPPAATGEAKPGDDA